ncbi:hypothetical protein ACS0TY_003415 [Phlomoides rotata]
MASLKLYVEKFIGKNDFGLWKVKMRALLIQHGLVGALKPDEGEEFQLVLKEKTTIDVWKKLESLYQTKLVSNKLYMKQKLLDFEASNDKNLSEQLDTFNRYVDDLEDLDVKLEYDGKAFMLLNALPKSLENFKNDVLFGRKDQISYDDVLAAVKTKILQVQRRDSKAEKKTQDPAKSLNVKFKKGKKSFKGNWVNLKRAKANPKKMDLLKEENVIHVTNFGHLRGNCSDKKGNKEAVVAEEGYDSAEVLTISEDMMSDEWVLDLVVLLTCALKSVGSRTLRS